MGLYALWTVAAALVIVWLLAVCDVLSTGGWVHVLLLIAVALMGATLFSRPRTV